MKEKITLKQVKAGQALPAPIYVSKPYVVLSKENVVLAAGDMAQIKNLSSYFDDFPVEVREHDMHANDNTKIAPAQTNHTPGPWIAEATDSHGNIEIEADSTGNGRVHGGQDTVVARVLAGARDRANANLIASAPEMLRAIDWLIEQLYDPKGRQTKIYDGTLAPDSDDETVLQYLKRISAKAHEQL